MRLIDAPVGLFEHNGNLALKTEYSTIHKDGTSTPDCYLVESGEYFWGGAKTVAERNNLEVKPIRQNCGNCDWEEGIDPTANAVLPYKLLPSLKEGKRVMLDEIIGGGE